ncbi:uncharacterized protein LOC116265695 [Nymphaea colorata]|nr:uncharacterized protein LOC116265695 [Nymphaea colorata]
MISTLIAEVALLLLPPFIPRWTADNGEHSPLETVRSALPLTRELYSLRHLLPAFPRSSLQAPVWSRPVSRNCERKVIFEAMGNVIRRLFDAVFGNKEMRVVMLGLDAAGKTTILYKLHIGEVLSTVPTIGFNVEKVQYKNVVFTVWDVGGQEKLRPLWRHYFSNTDGLIYVVDSLDRERIGRAAMEFQAIANDPLMRNSAILVFANKQDMKGAMSPAEVCDALALRNMHNRRWHIQGACALKGEGLYEGLDWLASTLNEMQASGIPTSVGGMTR